MEKFPTMFDISHLIGNLMHVLPQPMATQLFDSTPLFASWALSVAAAPQSRWGAPGTNSAKIITEMRGAELIVFRID